jgi:hypothetical protein
MTTFGFLAAVVVVGGLSFWIIYLQDQLWGLQTNMESAGYHALDLTKLTAEMADRLVKLEKAQSSEG